MPISLKPNEKRPGDYLVYNGDKPIGAIMTQQTEFTGMQRCSVFYPPWPQITKYTGETDLSKIKTWYEEMVAKYGH